MEPEAPDRTATGLRLVWSNPGPPRPRRRPTDLAVAIERHLAGRDGLSDSEFLEMYSGAAASGAHR